MRQGFLFGSRARDLAKRVATSAAIGKAETTNSLPMEHILHTRPANERRTSIPCRVLVSEDATGEFAPFHGMRVCQSRSGRWRSRHFFDSDGRCLFCDKGVLNND
jgi:hypothetical protein